MKYILIPLVSIFSCVKCFGDHPIPPLWSFETFISYQQGFGFTPPIIRPAFDYNTCWWLANAGVNYEFSYGVNAYLGIGLITYMQIQYGYAISLNKHMIRIRSDVPFDLIDSNTKLDFLSVGLFVEHTFDYLPKGTILGFTLSFCFLKQWR